MWNKIAKIIMRKPVALLILLLLATLFMGYKAQSVKVSYQFLRILPTDDSTLIEYKWFQKTFGEVSNTLVLAIESDDIYNKDFLLRWDSLMQEVESIEGVNRVFSATQLPEILKNDSLKRFEWIDGREAAKRKDLATWMSDRPFYDGIFGINNKGTK